MPEELSKLLAEWQPIETAPRDGSRFLGYAIEEAEDMTPQIARCDKNRRFVLAWDGTVFGDEAMEPLTHWMALPPAPKGNEP